MSAGPWLGKAYTKEEAYDWKRFQELAAYYPASFQCPQEMVYGHPWDATAYNRKGELMNIELKWREPKAFSYPDLYIELEKWMNLMKAWREKGINPIYINFVGDNDIFIYDLRTIEEGSFYANRTIRKYIQDRIGLRWEDALHLKRAADGVFYPAYKVTKEIAAK